ncbi:hypothetical protein NFI96_034424 [Prochilodus magdalenae]|nr:hypothetical protein NFI96_034424 [Prochilodus magdalenae]
MGFHTLTFYVMDEDTIGPSSVDTGHCPIGRCPTGRCPQDAAPQDAAHRTLPTGRCPSGRCPTGRCPTGRCPTGHCPTGRCWLDSSGWWTILSPAVTLRCPAALLCLIHSHQHHTLTHHHHVSVTAVLRMIHHPHHTCSVVVPVLSCGVSVSHDDVIGKISLTKDAIADQSKGTWTVRDDSSSAAAQCSVGHPLVLHQWAQDAAPQDAAPQDAAPQDADHRTLPHMTLLCWIVGLDNWLNLTRVDPDEEVQGEIHMAMELHRDGQTTCLRCHVIEARDLAPRDITGTSDPFTRILYNNLSAETSIIKKTRFPHWDETLELCLDEAGETESGSVTLEVWDWDMVGKNDFLGKVGSPRGHIHGKHPTSERRT